MIDILLLNYNDSETVLDFLRHVKNYKIINKILIVDNCSTDNSLKNLNPYINGNIVLISTDFNGGYGYGNNYGIKYLQKNSNAEYILLCNPDTIILEQTILKLYEFLKLNLDYAICAPVMTDLKGAKQYNTAYRIPKKMEYIYSMGILFSKLNSSFYYDKHINTINNAMDVGAVAGSLFLLNKEKMLNFRMYDESIFLYCEETVLGIKLKQNKLKTALLCDETFIHNHSVSISKTYKSIVSRKQILNKSKLYVIRNYYRVNNLEYLFAWIISKISICEVYIIERLRRII